MPRIRYWKDVDVLAIEVKKEKYEVSEEVAKGVILDLSKNGEILAVEILDASHRFARPFFRKLFHRYGVALK